MTDTASELAADLAIGTGYSQPLALACQNILNTHVLERMDQPTRSLICNLRRKLDSNSSVIVRDADKGNAVVITERKEYEPKVEEFLNTSHCAASGIDSTFVFNRHAKKVRSFVNNGPSFIKYPDRLLSPNSASPGSMNSPIKRVVSFNSALTHTQAKFLDQRFKVNALHQSENSVRNFLQLAQGISDVTPPAESILVSFNVEAPAPALESFSE